MKIQVVYRNYKPIHQIYYSFINYPPKDVKYIIPKPTRHLQKFIPIYRRFSKYPLVRALIRLVQKYIFDNHKESQVDLYHYAQMLPSQTNFNDPFVVDLEHIIALGNFHSITPKRKGEILAQLQSEQCKRIIPLTKASQETLIRFSDKEYKNIKKKVKVIYPALPNFYEQYKNDVDHSIIGKSIKYLNILFVGNGVYRKGLQDLLEAVKRLNNRNIKVYIVSNATKDLKSHYKTSNFIYIEPKFSKGEIIKKLFIPSDIFVMPTHGDSLGMVYLDALASKTPVITTRQFATPELVEDGINGFLLNSENLYIKTNQYNKTKPNNDIYPKDPEEKLVKQLMEKINMLYNDRELLEKLKSNANKEFISGGKFSISYRNKQLIEVYNKALKQ